VSAGSLRRCFPFRTFYALVPPVPRFWSGARAFASERIRLNLPPARVSVYRKRKMGDA
jgi:phosphatidylethanolamine/phosphatidyl-N-methylethanolamine N-methyltransferase